MSILLFLLWILLNGRVTAEIVLTGAAVTALLMGFMARYMGWSARRERDVLRLLPLFLLYLLNLLRETIQAAATVLLVALTPSMRPEPVLVEFHSGLPREYQNVILANSITLTPGTITVFQEGDHFLVHALRKEYTEGLNRSSFVRLLRKFP
ncbi:MAG: Na+/H+ antiporter subunit E [Oscillibacter sp.]|nr:Na+/H+ antiporter subunit E [Oscillibacter sp.]